jgi:peptide-methionine (R)-S-oxide reductase
MSKNEELTEEQWRERLTPEQYSILREKGTEPAFTGEYDKFYEPGTYKCAGCGAELFAGNAKFDSGSGWPSFSKPTDEAAVEKELDRSYGTTRTEVLCGTCDGHLGHVFPDGPSPSGDRFCINSAALTFEADENAHSE